MAVPKFVYFSERQPEVTYAAGNSGFVNPQPFSQANAYDSGCPGIVARGGNPTPSKFIFDVSAHALTAGWARFQMSGISSQTANGVYFTLKGATNSLLRLRATVTSNGTFTVQLEYFNGSTWVAVGSTFVFSSATYDVSWNIADSGGYFRLYQSSSLIAEFTGDTLVTADTTVNTLDLSSAYTSGASFSIIYGSIFIDTVDTRGLYFAVDVPTSAGTYATMTGTYLDVNEFHNEFNYETAYLIADADNEKFTANYGTINTGLSSTGTIETVIIFSAGIAIAEPSLYLKPLLRKSAIDYTPAGGMQMRSPYECFVGIQMNVDPSTGLAWASAADVHAFEMGFVATTLP